MGLPGKEPLLSHVSSLAVECMDCGQTRWRRPQDFHRFGVTGSTPLRALSQRLYCTACREQGHAGRDISVQAAFVTDLDRERANAYQVNSRAVPSRGSRARCA
jgi:hypothetical protein